MSSLDHSSDLKTDHESHEDKPECQSEEKSPQEWKLSLPSMTSTHSGQKFKTIIPEKFIFRDPNQRVLVMEGGVLIALEDKESITGEIFYMLAVRSTTPSENEYIFLAVSEGKLCLYCARDPTSPSLELKRTDITDLNSLEEEERLPFTFIKTYFGSCFRFESAANPGYFISTSNTPREPVGVTKDLGEENNTCFQFVEICMTRCL